MWARWGLCLAASLFANANATGTAASTESIRAGAYRVVARMIMPHLEENLRYAVVREDRCLERGDPGPVFPILRHQSLSGCELEEQGTSEAKLHYLLVCKSAEVATGAAWLTSSGTRLVGELSVKMGGKNMTFSQRVEATYRGACARP